MKIIQKIGIKLWLHRAVQSISIPTKHGHKYAHAQWIVNHMQVRNVRMREKQWEPDMIMEVS